MVVLFGLIALGQSAVEKMKGGPWSGDTPTKLKPKTADELAYEKFLRGE